MQKTIAQEFKSHLITSQATFDIISPSIEKAAKLCIECLKNSGKIILFGNGGSAGDAQHISAELVGRYQNERRGLPALALTTDSSVITSIGNDYGYNQIFSRQVQALANINDIVIGISSGGTSQNVINGLKAAKFIGCKTIGFSGKDGGEFNLICDVNIIVPAKETNRIQEMHILIGHIICQLIDFEYA
jgi:D-sedoheptulose 7-phosphate isomerase